MHDLRFWFFVGPILPLLGLDFWHLVVFVVSSKFQIFDSVRSYWPYGRSIWEDENRAGVPTATTIIKTRLEGAHLTFADTQNNVSRFSSSIRFFHQRTEKSRGIWVMAEVSGGELRVMSLCVCVCCVKVSFLWNPEFLTSQTQFLNY